MIAGLHLSHPHNQVIGAPTMDEMFKKAKAARAELIENLQVKLAAAEKTLHVTLKHVTLLIAESVEGPPPVRMAALTKELEQAKADALDQASAVGNSRTMLAIVRAAPLAPLHFGGSTDQAFGWGTSHYVVFDEEAQRSYKVKHETGTGDRGLAISAWNYWQREDGVRIKPIAYEETADVIGHPSRRLLAYFGLSVGSL